MFRLDGRQRSVSFQTPEHAEKFRSMVDLVGAAKALEVYGLTTRPRSVNGKRPQSQVSTPSKVYATARHPALGGGPIESLALP